MPRSQRNDNFIDKTFSVVADMVIEALPTSACEKQAFTYYRSGLSAQAEGEYASALQNYYASLRCERDPYDRSYILYNIGLIHSSNGKHGRALEYYYQALKRNPTLPQALNNIAVIYHYRGEQATEKQAKTVAKLLYDKAADYWQEAVRLAPTNYLEAQAWLRQRHTTRTQAFGPAPSRFKLRPAHRSYFDQVRPVEKGIAFFNRQRPVEKTRSVF